MEAILRLTPESVHPFVRCVGMGVHICQSALHCAYDHRLIAVLGGEGFVVLGEDRLSASPGDVFLIAPGLPYRVCGGEDQSVVVVNFDWTQAHADLSDPILSTDLDNFRPEEIVERADWSALLPGDSHLAARASSQELQRLRELRDRYDHALEPAPARALAMSGLLMQVLGSLHPRDASDEKQLSPLAAQLLDYIRANCTSPITLKTVCAEFHYHPSYINRVLSASCGSSFRQLLIRQRLALSLPMLEMTDLSLSEIALRVGFYDSSHFCQSFQKRYGVHPGKYR